MSWWKSEKRNQGQAEIKNDALCHQTERVTAKINEIDKMLHYRHDGVQSLATDDGKKAEERVEELAKEKRRGWCRRLLLLGLKFECDVNGAREDGNQDGIGQYTRAVAVGRAQM